MERVEARRLPKGLVVEYFLSWALGGRGAAVDIFPPSNAAGANVRDDPSALVGFY